MPRNPKRRQRVLLIVGVFVALGLAAGGTYYGRRWMLDREAEAARDEGRAALEKGDYEGAMAGMGRYITRVGNRGVPTAQDYVDYAKAREAVPLPNKQHLIEAMGALKRGLDKDPNSREAQEHLLDVYLQTGFATEALDLADKLLVTTPDDLKILRSKADVLEALRKLKEALDVAKSIASHKESDHDDLLRVLRLLFRTETVASDLNAWIAATAAAHPGDQFVELMRAIVLSMRGDAAGANAILDRIMASSTPADDPTSLAFLMQALDGTGRFDDTLTLLGRMNEVSDPALRTEIVRRLWYGGRADEMLARLAAWEGDLKTAKPELLAMHALGLISAGRRAESEPFAQELASRTDPEAKAWSTVARIGAGNFPGGTPAAFAALTEAARVVPGSAIVQCALGNAAAESGEWDAAVWAWSIAASRAPAWSIPCCGLSRAYRLKKLPQRALDAGRAAMRRAPRSVEAIRVWVEAASDSARSATPAQVAELLKNLATGEATDPKMADVTLPVRVELIARTDRAMAQSLIQGVLDARTELSEGSLLRLVAVATANGIALESNLLALSEAFHGITPRLALASAVVRARATTPEDGLAAYDAMRAKAPAGTADVAWSISRAVLLDGLGNPGATAAWAAVADGNPASLEAQLGAISSPSLAADREATARTIERLKGLTGEAGISWRIARAQWLTDAPSATDDQLAEATALLTAVVAQAGDNFIARVRLAQVLERTGDLKGAEVNLQAAAQLAPDHPGLALELARISQRQGHTGEARQKVDRVLTMKGLAPELAQRAAFLLAAEGDLGRSSELLQQLMSESHADREGTLLLAKIYARQGRTEDAIRLCESILDRPTAPVVELAAHLYATAGRKADAEKAIARLDGLGLAPGDVELARGRYAVRWGAPGESQTWFAKATEAAPGRADAWSARVGNALLTADAAAFTAVLQDPRASGIEDVQYLVANRDLCDAALKDAGVRTMLVSALGDKAGRTAITEALRVLVRDWPDPAKRMDAANTVRGIADANAGVLSLQLCACDVAAQTGDLRGACDRAQRTSAAFEGSPIAARRHAELLETARRWSDALEAGRVWKERSDRQDPQADVFLATTLLRLGRPSDAAAQLDDHLKGALANPDANERLLVTYFVALVRAGRAPRAEELMRPLAQASAKWRTRPYGVGPDLLGTSADAVAWINLCNGVATPPDALSRALAAQAWVSAATRFGTDELTSRAKRAVTELAAAPDATPQAHFLAGSFAQSSNDLETARVQYEAALKAAPDFDVVRNNLAMVLSDTGRASEAVEHAAQVVKSHPTSAEAIDTLAYALRKAKRFDDAKARLAEAIAMDPANPTWKVSLAETVAEAGDVTALTNLLAEIRKLEDAGAVISPELRARIDKFRSRK